MSPSFPSQKPPTFAAIDFETADYGRDSACALAIVHVRDGEIVRESSFLIRPPRRRFVFTYIHGITWEDVADQPTFAALWPSIREELSGADFLAAHNAHFDRSVLRACCENAGHSLPPLEFHCTLRIARRVWGISPASLPHVCSRLNIELRHHDPVSDARASARIVLETLKNGHALPALLDPPRTARPPEGIGTPLPGGGREARQSGPPGDSRQAAPARASPGLPAPVPSDTSSGSEVLLNSREAAYLLDIGPDEVVELARRNQIPGRKIGKTWRFRKPDLEAIRNRLKR